MIPLNKKTQQDFLNREWVQKLLDAGVDMSDAKYIIAKDKLSKYDDEPDLTDYIWYKDSTAEVYDVLPTYSVAELLYKLHEYIYPTIDGIQYAEFEYPIESLTSILIQCHKKDIGLKTKDTGNINNK